MARCVARELVASLNRKPAVATTRFVSELQMRCLLSPSDAVAATLEPSPRGRFANAKPGDEWPSLGVRVSVRATAAEPEGRRDERPEVLCAVQPSDAPISDGCVRAAAHEAPPTDECPSWAEPRKMEVAVVAPVVTCLRACELHAGEFQTEDGKPLTDDSPWKSEPVLGGNEQFQDKLCEVLVGGDPSVPYAAPLGPSAAFCFEARVKLGAREDGACGVDEGKSTLPGSCEGDSDCQGKRTCDGGWCRGKSDCEVCNGLKPSSGDNSAELCYNLAFYKDRADHLRDVGKRISSATSAVRRRARAAPSNRSTRASPARCRSPSRATRRRCARSTVASAASGC